MIDSHCHLYFDAFDADREEVVARARAAGIEGFVLVGIDLPTSRAAAELAARIEGAVATAGIHPTDVTGIGEREWDELDELLGGGAFVAVGETGLDHYWKRSSPADQAAALHRHLDLALAHDLPVVIHCRDAWPALLDLLEDRSERPRGVMHCFSGDVRDMERSFAVDFDVSFAGPLTYPRSEALREACRTAPLERLHVETDAPFLPPQPWRGKRNEPAYAVETARAIARLRDADEAETMRALARNTRRLFGLEPAAPTGA